MKIAIDVRIAQYSDNQSRGFGYLTRNLVNNLIHYDKNNEYFIIGYRGINKFLTLNKNVKTYEMFSMVEADFYQHFYRHTKLLEAIYFNHIIQSNNIDTLLTFSSGNRDYIINTLSICKTIKVFWDLIPLVFEDVYLKKKNEKRIFLKSLKAFEKSTAIISISNSSKNDLLKHINFPQNNIFTIYPGVASEFSPKNKDQILKIKTKYKIKNKYLFYVGGYDFRKNIGAVIESLLKIPKEILKNYQLVLAGNMYDKEKKLFTRMAQKLNVSNNLLFTGFVSNNDLPILYSGADIFLFPSLYEGFGLPLIEAMACGCPVIASNNSSIPEVVGDAALMVNPKNNVEIANAISKILRNDQLKNNLINKGYERVKRFTWKNAAQETIKIFNKL